MPWRFHACPRCSGDIYLDREIDAVEGVHEAWRCLLCGREITIAGDQMAAKSPEAYPVRYFERKRLYKVSREDFQRPNAGA